MQESVYHHIQVQLLWFLLLSGLLKSFILGVQRENSYDFYRDDQVQTQIVKSELLNYSRDPSSVVEKTAKQREKISHLVVWSKPRTWAD